MTSHHKFETWINEHVATVIRELNERIEANIPTIPNDMRKILDKNNTENSSYLHLLTYGKTYVRYH